MGLPGAGIGISTSAYEDLPLEVALDRISRISDAAEVLSEARHSLLAPKNLRAMRSFDLNYTVHGIFMDVNIASIHASVRYASMKLHRRTIKAAASAGASIYVVHPGQVAWTCCREQALQSMERSLQELRLMEKEFGIRVAVENMPKGDWLIYSRPSMDLGGLGTVLDVGHAYTCGSLDEFMSFRDVIHVHLHDNSGSKDEHLPLGRGRVDYAAVLRMVKSRGLSAVLELKSEEAVIQSMEAIRRIGLGA
jgi:sugar phosphate isomerase/epimerase